MNATLQQAAADPAATGVTVKRHSAFTRFWHWVSFACLAVLLMSGLQIFNAHPALYWGDQSHFERPLLSIGAEYRADGPPRGITRIGGWQFDTTGVLGLSVQDGMLRARAFPDWATLPGPQWLAMGRLWHFFFAWIFAPLLLAYLAYCVVSRRQRRKLLPRGSDWRHFGASVRDHLRLRFPTGEEAREYNILQKLAYLLLLFVLAPAAVATGLTMSPAIDAAWPWLPELFGGRQSARTLHFVFAFGLLGFFVVHVVMVAISGFANNIRSMITGRYALPPPKEPRDG